MGAMLEKYYKVQSKPKTIDELKVALQTIWKELPQDHINKAVDTTVK